jgi:hypothetical protein
VNNNKLLIAIASALFTLLTLVGGWAYNSMDTRIRATEERVDALMESLSVVRADVSYIRGRLEPPIQRNN